MYIKGQTDVLPVFLKKLRGKGADQCHIRGITSVFLLFSLKSHYYKRCLISLMEAAPYTDMLDSGQHINKLEIIKL